MITKYIWYTSVKTQTFFSWGPSLWYKTEAATQYLDKTAAVSHFQGFESCYLTSWWVTKHHLKLLVRNVKVCMAGTSSVSDKAIHERHRGCEKLDLALPRQMSRLAHHSLPFPCQRLLVDCGPEYTLSLSRRCCKCTASSWWMISQLWDHIQHDLAHGLMVAFCDLNFLPLSTMAGNVWWREREETHDVMATVQDTSKLMMWKGTIHCREGFWKHSCGECNAYFRP